MPSNIAYTVEETETPAMLDILRGAYADLRYAFGNTGYPNAGSFVHTCEHGVFMLTPKELELMKELKDANSSS